jgi:hypothetical protein
MNQSQIEIEETNLNPQRITLEKANPAPNPPIGHAPQPITRTHEEMEIEMATEEYLYGKKGTRVPKSDALKDPKPINPPESTPPTPPPAPK